MSAFKNQHYVPAAYFRFFSKDGSSINLLLKKNGEIINNASISGQSSKDFFYGDETAEKATHDVEGSYLTVLTDIIKNRTIKQLTSIEYNKLLQGIVYQKSRTLTNRNRRKESQDMLYRAYLEMRLNDDNTLDEKTKLKFKELIKNAEADPLQYHLLEMQISLENAHCLEDLFPIILDNQTDMPYIFSDNPVVLLNLHFKNITSRGVLGYLTPGIKVILPICDNLVLMLIDKKRYTLFDCEKNRIAINNINDVISLNKLQIHNSSNSIYYSNSLFSSKYKEIWLNEKNSLTSNKDALNEYPEYDKTGEMKTKLIHNFEAQLPFFPDFTFLYYEPCNEREYKFSRRE